MNSNELIWERILSQIEQNLKDNNKDFMTVMEYFSGSKLISFDESSAIIYTPSPWNRVMLSGEKLINDISLAFSSVLGRQITCQIISDNQYSRKEDVDISEIETTIEKDLNDFILPEFTFDNFVVGPSNREASTAALTVATDPGNKQVNPLFIYGDSGLGKTHLLHAIGNYIKNNDSYKKILYIPASKFVNEVVKSIKDNTIEEYKNQLNSLDVLLVDDIQSLTGATKSNSVFFTIYNELFNNRKQIVLTSDRPPADIKDIEERLKTRFSQGLSVTISSLEFETAYKILEMKIRNHNIDEDSVSPEVISYMATNFSCDVRNLEGALNRLLFYSINFAKSGKIDLQTAMECFKDHPTSPSSSKEKLEIKNIINAVCDYYNLTKTQLLSKNRTKNISNARHMSMYLCRKHLDVSYDKIGEEFGGMDHSTVLSAYAKIDKLVSEDEIYKRVVSDIEKILFR